MQSRCTLVVAVLVALLLLYDPVAADAALLDDDGCVIFRTTI